MIVKLNNLLKRIRILKKRKNKIVFTNGCFDIIHSGHIKVLKKCRDLGDVVIVGLNSDSSVRALKGPRRPINSERDRAEILDSIKYVDYVVIFNELTPYNLIRMIKPDFLVKGGDYKKSEIIGREFAKKVITVKMLKGRSTSLIIEKLLNK
jgi:D-beta-D-heptose 7-phosphate kinase/D-beta-D-heptose 1-phosphate adenosyltransferase